MAHLRTPDRPVLVCPECRDAYGEQGQQANRIGNRKTTCKTCNRFGQAVRRAVARALLAAHPKQAEEMRAYAEAEVYVGMCPAEVEAMLGQAEPAEALNGAASPRANAVGLPVGTIERGTTDGASTP